MERKTHAKQHMDELMPSSSYVYCKKIDLNHQSSVSKNNTQRPRLIIKSSTYLKNYANEWIAKNVKKNNYQQIELAQPKKVPNKRPCKISRNIQENAVGRNAKTTTTSSKFFIKEEPKFVKEEPLFFTNQKSIEIKEEVIEQLSEFDVQCSSTSTQSNLLPTYSSIIKEEPFEMPEFKQEILVEKVKTKKEKSKMAQAKKIKAEEQEFVDEPLLINSSIIPTIVEKKPHLHEYIQTQHGVVVRHLASTHYKNRRSITIKRGNIKKTISLIKNFAMVLPN